MLKNLIAKSQIIILEGARQTGKLTFALFAVKYLLQKDALVISAIEDKLYKRKTDAIYNRFETLRTLESSMDSLVLKQDWNSLKNEYSYQYFRDELERVFSETKHQVVIFQRFGLFFEFQDRLEIEAMFRHIVDIAEQYNKQVIFTISTANDNYAYMNNLMCDFADLTLDLTEPNLNERDIQIVHSIHKVDQEKYLIKGAEKTLILENSENRLALAETQQQSKKALTQASNKKKFRVLLVVKEDQKSEAYEIVEYLTAKRKMFEVAYISSIYDVPQYFNTEPDLVFFFIERNDIVDEVFNDLRKERPSCSSFVFFPQDFIRGADRRTLHNLGIDEIFSVDFQLDDLIIAMEKAVGYNFYEDSLKRLSFTSHTYDRKIGFDSIIGDAHKNSIFFSLFVFNIKSTEQNMIELGRQNDFVFHDKENHKIYYLALNTREFIADIISYRLQEKGYNVILEASANPINIEKCLAM